MTKYIIRICIILHCSLCAGFSNGQGGTPVIWTYKAEPVSSGEALLTLTGDILPGWHLYSQHLKQGGPQPTRISFDHATAYSLTGATDEKGNAHTYYDELYEMEITWYSGKVTFTNRIMLNQPVTTIKGTVEYMVCNDQLCVPDKRAFAIHVDLSKQHP